MLNPNTILSAIPSNIQYFSVTYLYSAFFSIPLNRESQHLLAYIQDNQQYTWTVMPQGFTEAPSYFLCTVNANLRNLKFPGDSALIQYVDDFLLCSES